MFIKLQFQSSVAAVVEEAPNIPDGTQVLINLSGRGDKDIFNIAEAIGDEKWDEFLRSICAFNFKPEFSIDNCVNIFSFVTTY